MRRTRLPLRLLAGVLMHISLPSLPHHFLIPLACSNCIGVCPTGALMFRSEHELRQAGTWEEDKQTQTDTICPYCGVGCTLTLHVQDNQIVKVTSPLDHDVGHG